MTGKIFLIPNVLHEDAVSGSLPAYIGPTIEKIRCFMVENERSARRLLKKVNAQFPIQECSFFELSEHASFKEAKEFFAGHCAEDIGIISEAGVPCVADPGADIVRLAHEKNMEVIPLIGPSSIILALMASGLSGQNFAFNGYLPKEKADRIKKIKDLEERSRLEHQTQIFMETPYRNAQLMEEICSTCDPQTALCMAVDITGPGQYIKTMTIKEWRKLAPAMDKRPGLFLLLKER